MILAYIPSPSCIAKFCFFNKDRSVAIHFWAQKTERNELGDPEAEAPTEC